MAPVLVVDHGHRTAYVNSAWAGCVSFRGPRKKEPYALRVTCFMKSSFAASVIPRILTLRVAMRIAKSTKNVRRPVGVHTST